MHDYTSKAKIKVFLKNFHPSADPFWATLFKINLFKTLILAFEANSALSRQIVLFLVQSDFTIFFLTFLQILEQCVFDSPGANSTSKYTVSPLLMVQGGGLFPSHRKFIKPRSPDTLTLFLRRQPSMLKLRINFGSSSICLYVMS